MYTLAAVIEGCDINPNVTGEPNKQIQVEITTTESIKDYITLRGDHHSCSFKNLSLYTTFMDYLMLDYCVDRCEEGMGYCPSGEVFCPLDGGNVMSEYVYEDNCMD